MTTSPAKPAVGGISDYDLPMLNTNIRLRVTWLKQLKTQALIRTAAGQHCDVSTLVREALALWADENDVKRIDAAKRRLALVAGSEAQELVA